MSICSSVETCKLHMVFVSLFEINSHIIDLAKDRPSVSSSFLLYLAFISLFTGKAAKL